MRGSAYLFFDELPDDACHLVSVHLDDWVLHFDFLAFHLENVVSILI